MLRPVSQNKAEFYERCFGTFEKQSPRDDKYLTNWIEGSSTSLCAKLHILSKK